MSVKAPVTDDPRLQHRANLAAALFDRAAPVHCMPAAARQIIERAAIWWDLPLPHRKKERLAAIRRLLAYQAAGLSDKEHSLLTGALLLHYREPKNRLGELSLSADERRQVITLTALLRMAAALDTSETQGTSLVPIPTGDEPAAGPLLVVALQGRAADVDAAAARQAAAMWVELGYPPIEFVVAQGVSPYRRLASAGIIPEDTLGQAARKVWRFQLAEMLRNEEGTRLGEDIEALHDMRVATRRMRAAFDVFDSAFERDALRPYLRGLRQAGRALGQVRDLDVFIEKAGHYLESLPADQHAGLEPLLKAWQEQRGAARVSMLAYLDSRDYHTFKFEFTTFLQSPGVGEKPGRPDRVCEVVPILIYSRLAHVRAYEDILETASITQLHALRIEFKKLRYAVEYFREVLGPEARSVIEDIKVVQDHLGDLHDADLAVQLLGEFLSTYEAQQSGLPVDERRSAEGVAAYLAARHAERHELLVTFAEAWSKVTRPEFRRNLALAVSVL